MTAGPPASACPIIFPSRVRAPPPQAGSGRKSKSRAPMPKFKCGLGNTHVKWPPLAHLTVAAIVAKTNLSAARGAKALQGTNNGMHNLVKSDSVQPTPKVVVSCRAAPITDTNEGPLPDSADESRSRIYLVNYAVGDPKYPTMGELMCTHRGLLSTARTDALEHFCSEVARRRIDKDFLPGWSRSLRAA